MHVTITAFWGNDDASSTIRISKSKWTKILAGEALHKPAWSWYEGKRYRVNWVIEDNKCSIIGAEHVLWVENITLDELIIE